MHARMTLLCLVLAVAAPVADGQDAPTAAPPAAPAKPKTGPASPANQRLAAEYNAAQAGVSMLVMIGGEVVFEDYPTKQGADAAHRLASGTKSFSGAMAVAAQMDGLLTLDEKLSKTLTEWEKDDPRSKITIRQLLSLCSGLDPGDNFRPPTYADAVKAKRVAPPGKRFAYGPGPFQLFGEIMRRKLAAQSAEKTPDVLRYLTEKVLTPIGLDVAEWSRGNDGNPFLPHGARLTAREWAKYGELIRRRGKWGEKQVLDAKLLEQLFQRSEAFRWYGVTWWLPQAKRGVRVDLPEDLVLAAGLGGQKLWVSRDNKMVVVRQAPMFNKADFDDDEFLARLLHGTNRVGKPLTPAGGTGGGDDGTKPKPSAAAERFLSRHDKNDDDILTADELPPRLVAKFDDADEDGDGRLTLAEIAAAFPGAR